MDLKALGWDAAFEEAFRPFGEAGFAPARITSLQANLYTAIGTEGEFKGKITGKMRHKCSQMGDYPAVGDWVAVTANVETGVMQIHGVLPRRSTLTRARTDKDEYVGAQVISANVDVVFVVAALDQELNLARLQRYAAQASVSGARTVLVLNKADLCADPGKALSSARVALRNVDIIAVSAATRAGLETLLGNLKMGETGTLVGPSGAGKSTLINVIMGNNDLATGAVRGYDSKGRQTTTHRELVVLPGGGMLIDNPGMRSLGLEGDESMIAAAYEDVEALTRACKFSDCQHRTEPGCAIKAALADGTLDEGRLASYKKFQREIYILGVKKSQRSREGAGLSKAIKRRQKFEKELL